MKPTINYKVYTPPSRPSRRMSTKTRNDRARERLNKQIDKESKRREAALALANKAKELAPTLEAAIALIPKSLTRTSPRSGCHIWSKPSLCLGKGETFANIGRWYHNCTNSMHGPRCKAAHFITPKLPDPGFQELLRLWANHDSFGAKYCREPVYPEVIETLKNPLSTTNTPVHPSSTSPSSQLPMPPNETLPIALSSLKRRRGDNQSPTSALPAKKKQHIISAHTVASASTSSAIHVEQLESSDNEAFPSPYTAFVRSYKPKAKRISPEIIDPQIIDISDDDEDDMEKKRIRKGKGKAE